MRIWGLMVEAGWHLEKLREIEAAVGDASQADPLAERLHALLLEEAPGFQRLASAAQAQAGPMLPHAKLANRPQPKEALLTVSQL
jgi:hypothetical protein